MKFEADIALFVTDRVNLAGFRFRRKAAPAKIFAVSIGGGGVSVDSLPPGPTAKPWERR
jgi:hypothetical protein